MRVFLFVIVLNMVFRNFSALGPWQTWVNELEMRDLPVRLPTREEIARNAEENPAGIYEDMMESADSVWEFWRPWPGPKTRPHLDSVEAWGKFALCWLNSRYYFVEKLVGVGQEWPMFSTVPKKRTFARSELIFADGTTQIIRQESDPQDLTSFSHWGMQKVRYYELYVGEDSQACCKGYCNLLAHRHPRNEQGSELSKIRLFTVWYEYPTPDADPREHLRLQIGPPSNQVRPPFFEYDVAMREIRKLPSP